jgi:acyl-coenzyme A thioesterase PaaI-like protein
VSDDESFARREQQHIVYELGFQVERVGEEMHGSAAVVPELYVPGTKIVRASVLACWADLCVGYLAIDAFSPRVPTTLELAVHLNREQGEFRVVHAAARLLKAGRSVLVALVDFTDEHGRHVALGTASFMAVPDPSLTMPREHAAPPARRQVPGRLRAPFAERANCKRVAAGKAVLARSEDGLNSANTVNGGLIALAIEEAALSVEPGVTLASMALRYLRPVRVGPAVATATVHAGLGQVEVRDAGSDDRLAVHAVTQTWPLDAHAEQAGAAA